MDLRAAASYLFASIAAEDDRELAADTYRAIADALPYHLLDDLTAAWNSLEDIA